MNATGSSRRDGSIEVDALQRWWHRIQSEQASGQDRADRAVLRRCHDIGAVACTPAFGRLASSLARSRVEAGREPYREPQLDRLAIVVGLAAHLRRDGELTVSQAMRSGRGPESAAVVSELRFQRVVAAGTDAELFVSMRRILPLLEGQVSFRALAGDLLDWGERVKKRWVYDYYDESSSPRQASVDASAHNNV